MNRSVAIEELHWGAFYAYFLNSWCILLSIHKRVFAMILKHVTGDTEIIVSYFFFLVPIEKQAFIINFTLYF